MNWDKVRYIYFIGIGGIGMSGLARYFYSRGYQVAGYDRTASGITDELQSTGIPVHFHVDVDAIPPEFLNSPDQCLVVYTPAVPPHHKELNYLQSEGFTVLKRAQVLGILTRDKFTIAVAGAHGKTSTATLITHLLITAGIPCYSFLGGISTNYESNYIQPPEDKGSNIMVVEADEYDRSFLRLSPDIGVLTSTDPDHLDIYHSPENLTDAYRQFASQIKQDGLLVMKNGTPVEPPEQVNQITTFSLKDPESGYYAKDLKILDHRYTFNIQAPGSVISDIQLGTPGDHNVLNALAAVASIRSLIRDTNTIRKGLSTYRGVKRRFEVILDTQNTIYIDDYAHHPSELRYTLETIRRLYPEEKVTAIFQPHLYSRTRDFAGEFAKVLSRFDKIILLDIYPAREEPIEGVNSKMILEMIPNENKALLNWSELIQQIKAEKNKIIITIGAGDIDRLVEPIKATLQITRDEEYN